jgi:hypothetical protein
MSVVLDPQAPVTPKQLQCQRNAVVIGNAITLASEVIIKTMGNDISNTLAGSPVKLDLLYLTLISRIRQNLTV